MDVCYRTVKLGYKSKSYYDDKTYMTSVQLAGDRSLSGNLVYIFRVSTKAHDDLLTELLQLKMSICEHDIAAESRCSWRNVCGQLVTRLWLLR